MHLYASLFFRIGLACLYLLCTVFRSDAVAQDKVALIIGNADYLNGPNLKTPLSDTSAIARMFLELGYDTALLQDATKDQMMLALAHLRIRSSNASKVVVYFAGHGLQTEGQSFLLLRDAQFTGMNLPMTAISLNTVVRAISNKARQKLIFIDACRDNPTYHIDQRSLFKPAQAFNPAGLFVMYASQPGTPVFDGASKHSPFAQSFLKHGAMGEEVEVFAKRVRVDVIRATQGQQLPWSQSSLIRPAFIN